MDEKARISLLVALPPSSHPEHLAGKGAATAFPSAPALKPTQMDTADGNEKDQEYDNYNIQLYNNYF